MLGRLILFVKLRFVFLRQRYCRVIEKNVEFYLSGYYARLESKPGKTKYRRQRLGI